VVLAIETAQKKGMHTIALLGGSGGVMKELCDVSIVVPSDNTQRIQETHITIGHIICESVEQKLYGKHE
jgi:D-sedoheptulose 7-phosphate isomerase